MRFNLLDLAVLAVVVVAVADGIRRGFVPYLTEFGALIAGLTLGFWLFQPLGGLLHRGLSVGLTLAGFGAFVVLLAAGHGLVAAPAHRGATWAAAWFEGDRTQLRRVAGGVSAAALAALVSLLALTVLAVVPADATRSLVRGSASGYYVADRLTAIRGPVHQLLLPTQPQSQNILVSSPPSNPGEDAFYKLTFPADLQLRPAPSDEDAMLARINTARSDNGLSPLRMDTALRDAARQHSRDMYLRHYFSHQTPDGQTPYARLKALKVHYLTAGENLAFAPDVNQAWDSLVHSPDHRANILNPDFRCVGVGAYQGQGGYEEMFTQDFTDCS